MNKTFLIGMMMMLMLAMCVTAYDFYENYTLNISMVGVYDNFTRTSSDVGNMTYPTNHSWTETDSSGTPTDTAEFYVDGDYLTFNTTGASSKMSTEISPVDLYTIEFDLQRINFSFFQFRIGDSNGTNLVTIPALTIEFTYGFDGCFGATNQDYDVPDDDWHHYILQFNLTSNDTRFLRDGYEQCHVNLTTDRQSINLFDFHSYQDSGDGSETNYRIDNFVTWEGTESPYCIPDWNCTSYGDCTDDLQECLNVTDLNTCGEPFEGLLSDYDEACETPEEGYTPNFATGDLPKVAGDLVGHTLVELMAVAGLVVFVVVGYVGVKQLRKTMKEVRK
jgi:hypothetical protein